jgi:hypothetical protein
MDLLKSGKYTDIQKTTLAYLEQERLDAEAYKRLLERQRQEKLKYLSENGMDGWDKFIARLEEEENIFLEELGMEFDGYNEFASTFDPDAYKSDIDLPDADNNPEKEDSPDFLPTDF